MATSKAGKWVKGKGGRAEEGGGGGGRESGDEARRRGGKRRSWTRRGSLGENREEDLEVARGTLYVRNQIKILKNYNRGCSE